MATFKRNDLGTAQRYINIDAVKVFSVGPHGGKWGIYADGDLILNNYDSEALANAALATLLT